MMRAHRQQGSVFLSSLVAISGLLALLAVGTVRSATELSVAERFLTKQQAFALAEGRMDEAFVQLLANPTFVGNCAVLPIPANTATTCTVADPGVSSPGTTMRTIQVTGTVRGVPQTLNAVVQVQSPWPFRWAVYAKSEAARVYGRSVSVPDRDVVDSYDSTDPTAPTNQAVVQTELTSLGTIAIGHNQGVAGSGKVDLYGDAVIGVGGNPDDIIESSNYPSMSDGVVYGARRAATTAVVLPPITPPTGSPGWTYVDPSTCPPGGTQTIQAWNVFFGMDLPAGCTLTIQGNGTIHLHYLQLGAGSEVRLNGNVVLETSYMSMGSNATVRVLSGGSTEIYVTTGLDMQPGSWLANDTQLPKNLALYTQPGGGSNRVRLEGRAGEAFYGLLYAPNTNIEATNGDYYGSFVGKMVFIGSSGLGTNLHYDLSLQTGSSPNMSTPQVVFSGWSQS